MGVDSICIKICQGILLPYVPAENLVREIKKSILKVPIAKFLTFH